MLAVLATTLALLVSSGVATGSAQSASPKKWVATFCGSALTWQKTLKSELAKLVADVQKFQNGDLSLPDLKGKVVAFLGKLVTVTDDVIAQLKGVGAPAVAHGDEVQQGELHAFVQAKKVFQNAKKAAEALPTSSAQEFGKGLTAVGSSITAAGHKISAAESKLHKYRSKALTAAAKHEPACSQAQSFLP